MPSAFVLLAFPSSVPNTWDTLLKSDGFVALMNTRTGKMAWEAKGLHAEHEDLNSELQALI